MLFKEYCGRITVCLLGLAIYAVGLVFGVFAGSAGTNGWNTLAIGLSDISGMSFGTAGFVIGASILIIDFIGKGKLGIGTVMNIFVVSILCDVFLKVLSFIPEPRNTLMGVIYTLTGQMILAFSTVIYMKAALGAGPRDTLMVIIGKRFPNAPIGAVRFGIEIAAMIAGILMGASFGIGSVLVIALQASFLQFACRVCRFEPRAVVNEDFADTFRRIRDSIRSKQE